MSNAKIKSVQLARIPCRICQNPRWDDGTRCQCGNYENPYLKYDGRGGLRDVRYTDIDGGPLERYRVKTGEGED